MIRRETPIVINFLGGPGIGKSTIAAGTFYELKRLGINCELVSEFAKDKVWEESFKVLDDELYIFAKQYHKMWRLKDKVDIIVTDSPLILPIYYNKEKSEFFNDFVLEQFEKFENITILLERPEEKYHGEGRLQTKDEAKKIDRELEKILKDFRIPSTIIERDFAISYVLDTIKSNYPELLQD